MKGAGLLLLVAILLRLSGSSIRSARLWLPHPAAGWLVAAAGVWFYAGAAGAWVSIVPALAVGAAAAVADAFLSRPRLRFLMDPVLVLLLGGLSIPAWGLSMLATAALIAAAAGYVVDRIVDAAPDRAKGAFAASPGVVLIALLLLRPWAPVGFFRLVEDPFLEMRIGRLALAPPPAARREVLGTGDVVWIETAPGRGSGNGALLLHGAHPYGSMQPAAVVLRRALLAAGFTVVSLDHPGYGDSPCPPPDAPVAAWDPLPSLRDAYERLRAEPGVTRVFVVGHSMGAREALRLAAAGVKLDGVALFGGGMGRVGIDDYWYERFHTDRRLTARIARERVDEIERRFYDTRAVVARLTGNGPPLLFVRFEDEWPNIVADRDELYDAIPMRKTAWELGGSDHYFGSDRRLDLVVGDPRATRRTASRLRAFASEAIGAAADTRTDGGRNGGGP